jgi:hypothetical protein
MFCVQASNTASGVKTPLVLSPLAARATLRRNNLLRPQHNKLCRSYTPTLARVRWAQFNGPAQPDAKEGNYVLIAAIEPPEISWPSNLRQDHARLFFSASILTCVVVLPNLPLSETINSKNRRLRRLIFLSCDRTDRKA